MKPFLTALTFALAATGVASAATDGTAGPDSTATVDMSLTVSNPAPFIQITGFQDFDLKIAPNGSVLEYVDICVYVSEPGVKYDLTISGTPLTDNQNVFDYFLVGGVEQGGVPAGGVFTYDTRQGVVPRDYFDLTPANKQDCSDGIILSTTLTFNPIGVKTSGPAKATVTMTVEPS